MTRSRQTATANDNVSATLRLPANVALVRPQPHRSARGRPLPGVRAASIARPDHRAAGSGVIELDTPRDRDVTIGRAANGATLVAVPEPATFTDAELAFFREGDALAARPVAVDDFADLDPPRPRQERRWRLWIARTACVE